MVNNRAFFISPMIGELKLRESELGKAITLLNVDALLPLSHIGVASTLAGMVDRPGSYNLTRARPV